MHGDRENGRQAVTDSSGNVFADLDLPYSEEDMLKVQIAREFTKTLERGGLTQKEAAKILGIDQPKVSAIVRGRLKGFNVGRLLGYLAKLGLDVDIRIGRRMARKPGRIKVSAVG